MHSCCCLSCARVSPKTPGRRTSRPLCLGYGPHCSVQTRSVRRKPRPCSKLGKKVEYPLPSPMTTPRGRCKRKLSSFLLRLLADARDSISVQPLVLFALENVTFTHRRPEVDVARHLCVSGCVPNRPRGSHSRACKDLFQETLASAPQRGRQQTEESNVRFIRGSIPTNCSVWYSTSSGIHEIVFRTLRPSEQI